MAYVPSVEYDIFISYAHANEGSDQWVTTLVRWLLPELKSRLGGADEFKCFLTILLLHQIFSLMTYEKLLAAQQYFWQ